MRIKYAVGTAALTLATAALAGCGSSNNNSSASGSGNYCADLKADKSFVSGFSASGSGNSPDLSKLDEVFSRMHALAQEAPSAVASDWKTLDGAITEIQSALKSAGLKPSDLASLEAGQLPKGVDPSKLQAMVPKLQALSSSDVSKAASAISSNAKSACGVDLSSSS